jgi:hypothetical protein
LHTDPVAQHVSPQTRDTDAQHCPVLVMHAPPLQSVDDVHVDESPPKMGTVPSESVPPSSPPVAPWLL